MFGLLSMICLWQVAGTLEGQAEPPAAKWADYYQRMASGYRVRELSPPADSEAKGIELMKGPVFSWTSLQNYDGGVFAWTQEGRPLVLATIFSFPGRAQEQRQVVHEFVSFADMPLAVTSQESTDWKPEPLAVGLPVPGRPAVGTTDNQIKLQARNLARRFRGHLNRRGENWDLRLLAKPLIEYGKVGDSVLGGGVFAFVAYSTDPEILLLVEARHTPDGTQWFYAPGRFSDKSLYLDYEGHPIWESLRQGHGSDVPDQPDRRYQMLRSQLVNVDDLR